MIGWRALSRRCPSAVVDVGDAGTAPTRLEEVTIPTPPAPTGPQAGGANAQRSRIDVLRDSPNVRRYLIGGAVSFVGSFGQGFAQVLLVLRLSDNKTAVPLIIALQTVPLLVLGTWGGTIADRFDNRTVLLVTSVVSAAVAGVLGVFVSTGHASVLVVDIFAVLLGTVAVFERPAAQAILSELVPPDDVGAAVTMNAMLAPIARLLGPPLASGLTAFAGLAFAFYGNALSYVVLLWALLRLRRSEMFPRRRATARKGLVKAGFIYARHDPVVGPALFMMFVVGLAAFNFQSVLPLMSKFTFSLNPADSHDAGLTALVQTISAVGSLFAGVAIGWIRKPTLASQAIWAIVFGAVLMAFAASPSYWWWAAIAFPVGIVATGFTTLTTSILQSSTRPDMLGRVMALFTIAFMGTTPLGAAAVAALASTFNARAPFVVGGSVTVLGGVVLLLRSKRVVAVRPA